MTHIVNPLTGVEADDVAAKRDWVRSHFEPESIQKYELLDEKLRLLDVILSNRWIAPTETLKLQCLGITFGDALAQQLGMTWVLIEDEYGRDPALTISGTSIFVYPLTAISKRVERGEDVNIHELFSNTCETILELQRQKG
ncbi:MAG: DUF3806 domain-containing protein [Chlorobiales bacterium]|nr:DUF3806 domain-containing protein [Chlorobiales bacterium]